MIFDWGLIAAAVLATLAIVGLFFVSWAIVEGEKERRRRDLRVVPARKPECDQPHHHHHEEDAD